MVSGEENIGNFPAAELGWPGVLRRFEQTLGEAVIDRRLLVAQDAGKQPDDRVNENNRGDRAIRQDVIADRNLHIDQMLDDAVVDPFVMTANDDEMFFGGKMCAID